MRALHINRECCMLPGCVVSQQLHHPKRMQEIITHTHTHTKLLPCQAGGRRSQEGSQSQCAAALKELSRTRKSLNKQQGAGCTTPQLAISLPLHLICLSSPSPARPLAYGALDRDANVTRTAAAHSHAPNFHYQMRTFIYKLFLFSCCFRFFLSFFSSSLSLFLVVIFCVLRCICCSDFSGAYHQSGKSSGKLAACCTQLFACHLMHFLFSSRQLL